MIVKKRDIPPHLTKIKSLKTRLGLSKEDNHYLSHLVKGFEGECVFDSMMEKLTDEILVLNDLLLQVNGNTFQIDSLIITGKTIIVYEIKNYEGEYIFQDDRIKLLASKKEIMNPNHQLNRTITLFRQLLEQLNCRSQVQAYVAFVNRRFTLFQAPPNRELLLPTMLDKHFEYVSNMLAPLNHSHKRLAHQLCKRHLKESPYQNLPQYDYDELKKGIVCVECSSWRMNIDGRVCYCEGCGHNELTTETILRHVQEYRRLFPGRKITTGSIHEWCAGIFSKKSIRLVLEKHFQLKGSGRGAYYS